MAAPHNRDEADLANEEAYASLLEICTELIIADGTDAPPPKASLKVLNDLLHCPNLGGDATVLSVRAVRILLDKFIATLPSKSRAKLVECVRAALSRVHRAVTRDQPSSSSGFAFVHTKAWELQEELLQCMSAAAQSDKTMQAALPPARVQLRFCTAVMDVSLDMCLQALRMCSVMLRSGNLTADPTLAADIHRLFQIRLTALESMEMNQEWLRLLRHLTEGIVTLRAYAAPSAALATKTPTSNGSATAKQRKRQRSSAPPTAASALPTSSGDSEAVVLLRLCQRVCASPRLDRTFRSTVFSCANAVLSDGAAVDEVPARTCVDVVVHLARELTRNVRTTLTIVNPFLSRDGPAAGAGAAGAPSRIPLAGGEEEGDEDDEQGEDLLSNGEGVRWQLPGPEWPLVLLIGKVLAAQSQPSAEHMWWWVGDDEYARRFSKDDRQRLTAAFFAGQDVLELKKRGGRVHLSTMRELQWPFAVSCRVLLQPVPCSYAAVAAPVAPSFRCGAWRARELGAALQECDLRDLLEHLSAAAHYDGDVAAYGQSVLLQVLLVAGPHATDATRAALRHFLTDASAAAIEGVAEALVRYDRAWAGPLLDAGVTETILRRSTAAKPERSPVVQMLRREAASLPSTPPLPPHHPAEAVAVGPDELRHVLQHGSRAEVRALLEELCGSPARACETLSCVEAVRGLAATESAQQSRWGSQLAHLLTALVVKRLQDMTAQLQPTRTLKQIVEEADVVEVQLCERGRAAHFSCPSGHALHHLHGLGWKCNGCGATTREDAWSCRRCDYDLCVACARGRCNRMSGAVTATAQELQLAWRASSSAPPPLPVLFTEARGLVSAATPLAQLRGQAVHLGELYAACPCGLVAPGPACASARAESSVAELDTGRGFPPVLGALLSGFGRTCGQDVGVQRCLLRAFEAAGVFVFLGGACAVPAELRGLAAHLAAHLPMPVKHLLTRYVAVDCRRFAFQNLHDQAATVMSANTGVAPESSKAHKTQVPRNDKPALLRVLHDSFSGLPSPLVKVDFTFEGEEGFGSGPSQEVYTELSAYMRAEGKFWFATEDDGCADAVALAFPSNKALFLKEFFALGAACARAFIDDYRMDLDLLPQAWPLLMVPSLGLPLHPPATPGADPGAVAAPASTSPALMHLLEALDPALHRTFAQLRGTAEEELASMELEMDSGELITTHAALERHVHHTVAARFEVALENLRHLQWGLLSVMEVDALWCLTDEEKSALICGAAAGTADGPLFTEDELRAQATVGNGYSSGSPHVEMLLSIVGSDFTRAQQHDFLEFLTGSPRLPFNGLAGLGRLITVAMKDMDGAKEQTLPSCNTCFLYLKLPPYSTRAIMKERLLMAVTEGRRNYSLS